MLAHLCAVTQGLYILWLIMAQVAGQEEREKTTALKDLLSRIDLDELMKKDEPPLSFPKTLEEFEYTFNEKGQLRHIKTGEAFVFNAREDLHRWNQKRYEALGEIITQCVYELLEKKCNMTKEILPVDATEDEPTSFTFLSPDALSNPSKLLVLIQGSGVVRAGQWARRLIINQDLNSGSQIPFITRAMEEGYGVIVLNPNENYLEVEKPAKLCPLPSPAEPEDEPAEKRERKDDKESKKRREFYEKYRNPQKERETKQIPIRENASPEEHVLYVWDHFVSKAAAKNVFIMAHSYGGLSFVELMNEREMEVKNRVCAVALTDSAHNIWLQETSKGTQDWMQQRCRNWVSSPQPLDTPVKPMLPDCPRVSAGTEKHELTSWMSFDSIFKFFGEALEAEEDEEAEASNTVTTRSSSLKSKHQDL
ncbi:LOW QUALITY PROTEIN: cotranscriptional regulator FAM172A homolog [Lampris incognitus]|uniref:LOW QUALITY PROTEIN: cotranscriptional regulator FAM172A homolog n=1 Tax=Lampris incognitus TaxID=2546036 RepID=UPI0024B4BB70|nr:LOW QUALITY PROTEIN: cotranscriptional regulator FAM172A homolog [Lampris incognitus]